MGGHLPYHQKCWFKKVLVVAPSSTLYNLMHLLLIAVPFIIFFCTKLFSLFVLCTLLLYLVMYVLREAPLNYRPCLLVLPCHFDKLDNNVTTCMVLCNLIEFH